MNVIRQHEDRRRKVYLLQWKYNWKFCPFVNFVIYNMTVDIYVSRSTILILKGSRSTVVNTKYQQQQTNNLNSVAFLN